MRTAAKDLKLIRWSTGGNTVSRLADSGNQAGEVSEISMTREKGLLVTAVRTASNTLKLISWRDHTLMVRPLTNITRLKDSGNQAGEASLIAIQPVGISGSNVKLVTACRTGKGILRLISWNLDSGDGTLTRLGDSGNQADEVSLIALTTRDDICITAVRTAGGTLKLISWRISQDGKKIDRVSDSGNQAGAVSEISMAGSVTAVRTGERHLKADQLEHFPRRGHYYPRRRQRGRASHRHRNLTIFPEQVCNGGSTGQRIAAAHSLRCQSLGCSDSNRRQRKSGWRCQ